MSLALAGVSHRYRASEQLLNDINVAFEGGTSTAITGPSGSGKTTLLSIVGLLLRPTAGNVSIDGQLVQTRADAERARTQIGWMFQSTNVLPDRTVADNVTLGGLGQGKGRAALAPEVASALNRVGLGGFESRRAASLSGGELQRLCIARTLVRRPAIVVADEPTGQLDRTNSALVADILVSAFGSAPVVVATHDERVARLCDREYRLADGKLETVR